MIKYHACKQDISQKLKIFSEDHIRYRTKAFSTSTNICSHSLLEKNSFRRCPIIEIGNEGTSLNGDNCLKDIRHQSTAVTELETEGYQIKIRPLQMELSSI